MKHLFAFFMFAVLFSSCDNNSNKAKKLVDLIPSNATLVIKSKNIEGLKSGLKSNTLIDKLSSYSEFKNLEQNFKPLIYFNPNSDVLICLSKDANDSLEFSVISRFHKDIFKTDSITNIISETVSSKTKSITKSTINNKIIYSTIVDSIFIASNRLKTLESSIENNNTVDDEFRKIYSTTDNSKTFSIISKSGGQHYFPKAFVSDSLNNLQFSNYLMLDVDVLQDDILSNGITKATDSSQSLINSFKGTFPQENLISKISPKDTDAFVSYTFNDIKIFKENLDKFYPKDSTEIETEIFDNIIEVGTLYSNNKTAVFFNSLDPTTTAANLDTSNPIETYRDIDIYEFKSPELISDYFSPLITNSSASNYLKIEDFFVFSNDIDFLKEIISNYQNNTTLFEQDHYSRIMQNLSDEASILIYGNASRLNTVLNTNFSEEKTLDLSGYQSSAIQYIYDTDFAHVNAIIKKHKAKRISNSISEETTITLEDDLLTNPQLVTNHTNNQKDIVVQDVKNNLYLISNDGKIYWKKQLEGKILGTIEQIDSYKNGRLQLVFATSNRVYVLDRNGKDVSGFPLKFNDQITQPLSVFDYDKKKNYRLLVTQGKSLLMYDKDGKIVKGFTYKKAPSTINTQPQHFRIGNKDYIVFSQGKKLEILDRTGKTRVKASSDIDFSNNNIYLYNNKFTTTTNNGVLIQIDQNGKFSSANLNLKENHKLTTTSKTLVTLSENKLDIKSKTVELDYGEYTEPQIFYIYDKIYVTTTDLQSKKIYLFDSQAKSIANFPIYGNSAIVLDNIDKDRNLEVITKGDTNSIILYQIN